MIADRLGELADQMAAGEIGPDDIDPQREVTILALRAVSDNRKFALAVGRRMLETAKVTLEVDDEQSGSQPIFEQV